MHSSVERDAGSFRDPEGFVFFHEGKIYRSVSELALPRIEKLLTSPFFQSYIKEGKVIPTHLLENPFKNTEIEGPCLIQHEKIPLVLYPYEWSFSMLKEGALLTLNLLKECLENDFILKDGTAWNVTYHKGKMCFFDVLSIGEYKEGQVWEGYNQFCQEFLYPLFLKAYKNIEFQSLFKGSLKGIDSQLTSSLFDVYDWRLPGVFKHVFLNTKFSQSKSISRETVKGKFTLPKTSLLHMVNSLISLVAKIKTKVEVSTWIDYTTNNTYQDEDLKNKEKFIASFIEKTSAQSTIIDLGCNTGHFSKLVASKRTVISCDIDSHCIDDLYHYIRHQGGASITPVVLDLMNPGPACGWRLQERKSIYDRLQADGFLALALIHHLCIAQNVPVESFVSFLRSIASQGVVEWVSKEDPMVQFLLRNRSDIFANYQWEYFEECILKHFIIEKTEKVNDGARTLCLLKARA